MPSPCPSRLIAEAPTCGVPGAAYPDGVRRIVTVVAALVVAGCSLPIPSPIDTSTPTPKPVTALDARQVSAVLRAAQAHMFANRYSAADSAYARLLREAPLNGEAHAEYALFLNYRNLQAAARMEAARAVALDAGNGHVTAIQCRVEDWSQQLPAALSNGRRAVKKAPADPLAHLFLAEVLADTGDLTGSQREIDAASPLIDHKPTDYLQAERQREMANLAGARGDRSAQIAAFTAARATQPLWLYRSVELVDAEVTAGDRAAAASVLDVAAMLSPDDVETLRVLGEDALFAGDASAAAAIWAKARALAPGDAQVLDMAGEAAVAATHDINAGVAAFLAALNAERTDADAAAYLLALSLYVQHRPPLGRSEIADATEQDVAESRERAPAPPPDPETSWAAGAAQALAAVNAARAAAGLGPVRLESRLTSSARSHSYYWLFNVLSPAVAGLGIHSETPGAAGFSGRQPWDRATAFGYPNQRVGEDIAHQGSATDAVGDWVNSVYHRFAIMRPDLSVIGFGSGAVGALTIQDMEFGFAPARSAPPVLYPGPAQTQVPATFVDNELPDPVPAGKPRTTGYPVTVTFSVADTVRLSAFTLAGPDGTAVVAYLLPPSAATENSASLLPAAPLSPGATYSAHVVAVVNGRRFDRTWSFTTAS